MWVVVVGYGGAAINAHPTLHTSAFNTLLLVHKCAVGSHWRLFENTVRLLDCWTFHTLSERHVGDVAEAEDGWYRVFCSILQIFFAVKHWCAVYAVVKLLSEIERMCNAGILSLARLKALSWSHDPNLFPQDKKKRESTFHHF